MTITIDLLPSTGIVYDAQFDLKDARFALNSKPTQTICSRLFEERGLFRGAAYFVGHDQYGIRAEYFSDERRLGFVVEPTLFPSGLATLLLFGTHGENADFRNTRYTGQARLIIPPYKGASSFAWQHAGGRIIAETSLSFDFTQLDLGR